MLILVVINIVSPLWISSMEGFRTFSSLLQNPGGSPSGGRWAWLGGGDAGVQTSGDARCSKSAELPLSVFSCHADL